MACPVAMEGAASMSDHLTVILPPVLSDEKRIAEALNYGSLTEGDGFGVGSGYGDGDGYGSGSGWGHGYGHGYGYGHGDGYGWGTGYGYGTGRGDGKSSVHIE